MKDLFFVNKQGVGDHGIFYISENKELAIEKCMEFANMDSDRYHLWVVAEYEEQAIEESGVDAVHDEIFWCRKGDYTKNRDK